MSSIVPKFYPWKQINPLTRNFRRKKVEIKFLRFIKGLNLTIRLRMVNGRHS
ncbi:hypothetical protein DsansV1_C28g0206121 [Dioscorea sansibarensis]